MHRVIYLFLLLTMPRIAGASENLIENLHNFNNTIIADGVVHQDEADTTSNMIWKVQIWYNNTKHSYYDGTVSFYQPWQFLNNQIGFISYTFTTPDDLDDLAYFRFGLNGRKMDTTVWFDIKDVQPNTTYTLQWRMLNTTQGEVSWTDMFLTQCADGTALPLGTTQCAQVCPAAGRLHMGDGQYRLWANRVGTPALGIGYNGQMCYGHLASGHGAGLNVSLNGAVYHLID